MKKLYRYFKFQLKMTGKNLARHFGLAMSAAFSVTITLVLISSFLLLTSNLSNFGENIQGQVTIGASIDPIVKQEEEAALQEKIEKMDNVKSVQLSTGDEELEAYKKEYADESSLFDMYEGETNPIRDTFVIEVKNSSKIADTTALIEKEKGIVKADYGGEATASMLETFSAVQKGSMIFIAFLILVALFLISNKIKMSIYTRKSEIAIMRFVGAGNWNIRFPMMLEGMIIGLIGAVIPIVLTIVIYQWIYDLGNGIMLSSMFTLQPVYPLTLHISILLAGIGILVGLIGSFFSTSRYLRWKR